MNINTCCSDVWTADLIQLEGHKCGIFDEADAPDAWDVVAPNGVELAAATDLVAAA